MSWDIELANELKKKENVVPIGVVEGEIISIAPTRISIKEGKIILEPEMEKGRIVLTSKVGENEEITLFFAPTLVEKIGIAFSILGLILLLVVVFY